MPNKPAATKALRQSKRRAIVNAAVKDELKRTLKKARRMTDVKGAEAEALLRKTVQMVDKAVRKKVLKKNAASRVKSRLMKSWNKKKAS